MERQFKLQLLPISDRYAVSAEKRWFRRLVKNIVSFAVTNAEVRGGGHIRKRSTNGRCIPLPVPAVTSRSQRMEIPSGNIVPMSATSEAGSRVVMAMDKEEFRAEKIYQVTISLVKSMRKQGIISEEDYAQIDTILLEKYRPVLGTLLAGKPLT